MNTGFPMLSILIWLPIFSGLMCCFLKPWLSKCFALIAMLFSLGLGVALYINFDVSTFSMQFVELQPWLPDLAINYELGVDGIALAMILLTILTTTLILLATCNSTKERVSQYIGALLILNGLTIGVFSAINVILFYVFWETTLIPMFLIVGIWGSHHRAYAAMKFFIYTFIGSVLMLVALLYLGAAVSDFTIAQFYDVKLSLFKQKLIFIAFFLAFAIKVPMWPMHTWLPDAHTEAPSGGSMMLAAILLKMGAYGFLRFSLPIVPDACRFFSPLMITLSLIAVVYIGLVAIVQTDVKRLIAYSSISHMGFVTLGSFVLYQIYAHTQQINEAGLALEGALIVIISHGFVSSALFAGIGFIYERMHTRQIKDFGGIVNSMPVFSAFFLLFSMANVGLPGTSGFVGEFMVILGSLRASFWISLIAALTLILGAAYTLWMYKRVFWGDVPPSHPVAQLQDICGMELLAFSVFAIVILLMGLYPKLVLDLLHTSSGHLLVLSQVSKL